jgi:hypothetical protein
MWQFIFNAELIFPPLLVFERSDTNKNFRIIFFTSVNPERILEEKIIRKCWILAGSISL